MKNRKIIPYPYEKTVWVDLETLASASLMNKIENELKTGADFNIQVDEALTLLDRRVSGLESVRRESDLLLRIEELEKQIRKLSK